MNKKVEFGWLYFEDGKGGFIRVRTADGKPMNYVDQNGVVIPIVG